MYNQRQPKLISESHIDHLKKHIGKRVRIEYLTPNQNNEICGQLIKVGKDFLTVKLTSLPLTSAIINIDKVIKIEIIFE